LSASETHRHKLMQVMGFAIAQPIRRATRLFGTGCPYIMADDKFEWDEAKAVANAARHGVSFEAAKLVFNDPFAIERLDDRENYGEQRFNIIGMVEGRVLFVSYTIRNDVVRIISARGAEPYEKRRYHEENS
jgi:uncharacterized DUF497 family protein